MSDRKSFCIGEIPIVNKGKRVSRLAIVILWIVFQGLESLAELSVGASIMRAKLW